MKVEAGIGLLYFKNRQLLEFKQVIIKDKEISLGEN